MMLAQVREEYVFKTLDPALAPERKSEPKRAYLYIGHNAGRHDWRDLCSGSRLF